MKKLIKSILIISISAIVSIANVVVSYAESTENIYVYFTDDGKTLHFTSDKNKGSAIETKRDGNNAWWTDRFDLFEKEISTTPGGEKNEYVKTNKVTKITIDKKISPESCYHLFSFHNLVEIENIKNLDTKNTTNFEGMFRNIRISEIDLSSFNWDKSSITNAMFEECKSLEKIELGKNKKGSLKDISYMFKNCSKLKTIDLSKWELSNIDNAKNCFEGCESLEQVVFPKSQPRLRNIAYMFNKCKNINVIDLSNLLYNNEGVEKFNKAFSGCTNLKEIKLNTLSQEQFSLSLRDIFSDISDDGKVVFKDKEYTKREILSNINLKSKKDIIENCFIEVYRKDNDTYRYVVKVSPLDKNHQYNNVSFDLTIYILEGANMYTNISWRPEKTVVKKITLDQNGNFEKEYNFLKDAGYANTEVWEGSVWRLWYNEIENVNGTVVDLKVK